MPCAAIAMTDVGGAGLFDESQLKGRGARVSLEALNRAGVRAARSARKVVVL